ncbi:DUF6894 family protein [Aminobacter aganoensis]|uniref:DUF6894 domain-containing protein n=1 Tax=Aminobacter aganoensis TaxID=83264 RepID=A0A7X0FCE1_9HYPH|nr:hypothetical protein [Aminobacter aganoensis]MBB6357156.1 hypothetical protein [Aminobacter aganoensis]
MSAELIGTITLILDKRGSDMPKYRFEFLQETDAAPVVLELADEDAAKAQARQAMAEAVLDHVSKRHDPSKLATRIYDEAGYLIATVDFGSVFTDTEDDEPPSALIPR